MQQREVRMHSLKEKQSGRRPHGRCSCALKGEMLFGDVTLGSVTYYEMLYVTVTLGSVTYYG